MKLLSIQRRTLDGILNVCVRDVKMAQPVRKAIFVSLHQDAVNVNCSILFIVSKVC